MDPSPSDRRRLLGRSPGVIPSVLTLFALGSCYGLMLGELDWTILPVLGCFLVAARIVGELRLRGPLVILGVLLALALGVAFCAGMGWVLRARSLVHPQPDTGL